MQRAQPDLGADDPFAKQGWEQPAPGNRGLAVYFYKLEARFKAGYWVLYVTFASHDTFVTVALERYAWWLKSHGFLRSSQQLGHLSPLGALNLFGSMRSL